MGMSKPIPEEQAPEPRTSRVWIGCSWDDVPHLTEREKIEMLDGVSDHMKEVRSTGIPSQGTGLVYPLDPSEYTYDPRTMFPKGIPPGWARSYGMDIGWNHYTVCLWSAWDRDTDTRYYYSEHAMRKTKMSEHVTAIKMRGPWITGAVDPSGGGTNIANGEKVLQQYISAPHSLKLIKADNAVEAGISQCLEDLSVGRAKISTVCRHLLMEMRQYHYHPDHPNVVVKQMDDACDAFRYDTMSYKKTSKAMPSKRHGRAKPTSISFGA